MNGTQEDRGRTIDLKGLSGLTPAQLLVLARRLSLRSWLVLIGVVFGLAVGGFTLGQAYGAGDMPEIAYALHRDGPTPKQRKNQWERRSHSEDLYDELVNWQTLQSLAASIAQHEPDGLETAFEIAVSLLSQVSSSGDSASFFFGDTELRMTVSTVEDALTFGWEETPSLLHRIFSDADYPASPENIRAANVGLNRAGFVYLDDAMRRAVIYRQPNGSLALTIRE